MAVHVSASGVLQAGIPKLLFEVPANVLFWDVTSDGRSVSDACAFSCGADPQPPFTVVLNWMEAPRQRVPTR
jgi:hypothetical protein